MVLLWEAMGRLLKLFQVRRAFQTALPWLDLHACAWLVFPTVV